MRNDATLNIDAEYIDALLELLALERSSLHALFLYFDEYFEANNVVVSDLGITSYIKIGNEDFRLFVVLKVLNNFINSLNNHMNTKGKKTIYKTRLFISVRFFCLNLLIQSLSNSL